MHLESTRGFLERIPPDKETFVQSVPIINETPLYGKSRLMLSVCGFANHLCVPSCD